MMHKRAPFLAALVSVCVHAGCNHTRAPDPPYASRAEAITVLIKNKAAIGLRLKVKGGWSGQVTDMAGQRIDLGGRFTMDVAMPSRLSFRDRGDFAIPPRFEAGCNASVVWYWQKYPDDQDCMALAARDVVESGFIPASEICFPDLSTGMPIQPQVLLDGLGLAALEVLDSSSGAPRCRLAEGYNQLLFDGADSAGRPFVLKEFWLTPQPPRVIQRVVYRDLDGRVVFSSQLSGHRLVEETGLQLARRIRMEMPIAGSALDLTVTEVRTYAEVDRDVFVDPETRALENPREFMPRIEWLTSPPAGRDP